MIASSPNLGFHQKRSPVRLKQDGHYLASVLERGRVAGEEVFQIIFAYSAGVYAVIGDDDRGPALAARVDPANAKTNERISFFMVLPGLKTDPYF
jgi:hypothetical protein